MSHLEWKLKGRHDLVGIKIRCDGLIVLEIAYSWMDLEKSKNDTVRSSEASRGEQIIP